MTEESRGKQEGAKGSPSPPRSSSRAYPVTLALVVLVFGGLWGAIEARLLTPEMLPQVSKWMGAHNEATPVDPAVELFTNLEVHQMDLVVAPAHLAELSRNPSDYVDCELSFDGKKVPGARVRLKGNRSFQPFSGKPAFKLKFSPKALPGGFYGFRSLSVNNLVEDPTHVRESLAYEVYRDAGVPAPRTTYADVTVNKKPYGLHLLVEPIEELLLARETDKQDALLYEGEYSCDFYADDVFGLQHKLGNDSDRAALKEFIGKLDAAKGTFFERASPSLNEEEALTFLAINQILGDFDGYAHGHNYFMYFRPADKKWQLLPWGQDRVFYKRPGLYESWGRIARECFWDEQCRLRYVQTLQRVAKRFVELDLGIAASKRIRLISKSIKSDPRLPFSGEEIDDALEVLDKFIKERPAEILKMTSCWDGTKELDRDGDGFGCMDCDDESSDVHPGAAEACNDRDDNCNGLIDDHPSCECQSLESEGAHFSLCDLEMNFEEAEKFCEARGEKLAHISSRDQAKDLQKATQDIRSGDWWVALTDRLEEGEYVWDETKSSGYQRWASSEPQMHACGQDCASINRNRWANFRDLHCMERVPFVCWKPTPDDSEDDRDEAASEGDPDG